jgi:4-aminobutyrate aminotransferase
MALDGLGGSPSFSDLVAGMSELLSASLIDDWPNLPVERAEGAYFYTGDGRRYLDFSSGMATANVGHRHPEVVTAAKAQIDKLIHGPVGVVMYEPILRLASELGKVTPEGLTSFFFSNSGAEAIEGCLKLARYVTGRPGIICFYGGFHGRTYGAATVTTSKVKYRKHYEPMVGAVYPVPFAYCYRCPYGQSRANCSLECLLAVERLLRHVISPDEVAVILVEPIQGEGGYVVPPVEFLQGLRDLCDEHGILLAFDEVQTGFGRTGSMFASQTFGVRPDLMALAKGIANGFPLSATVARPDLMKRWTAGAHGTTYGGNPVSCAAALAVLRVLEKEKLVERSRRLGEMTLQRLGRELGGIPGVGDIRGRGLMIGLEFTIPGSRTPDPGGVTRILRKCLDQGLILYPCGTDGQSIRFIPPLVVSEEDLGRGIDILAHAVKG